MCRQHIKYSAKHKSKWKFEILFYFTYYIWKTKSKISAKSNKNIYLTLKSFSAFSSLFLNWIISTVLLIYITQRSTIYFSIIIFLQVCTKFTLLHLISLSMESKYCLRSYLEGILLHQCFSRKFAQGIFFLPLSSI